MPSAVCFIRCDAPRAPQTQLSFGLDCFCSALLQALAIASSTDQPMVAFDSSDGHPVTGLLVGRVRSPTSTTGLPERRATPLCHAAPPGGDRGPLASRCLHQSSGQRVCRASAEPLARFTAAPGARLFLACAWVPPTAQQDHSTAVLPARAHVDCWHHNHPPPPDGALLLPLPATVPWPQIHRQQMASSALQFQSSTLSRVARPPGLQRCRRQRRRVMAAAAAAAAAVWRSSLCMAPAAGRMPPLCAAVDFTRSPCGQGLAARKSCVTTAGEGGCEGLMHALARMWLALQPANLLPERLCLPYGQHHLCVDLVLLSLCAGSLGALKWTPPPLPFLGRRSQPSEALALAGMLHATTCLPAHYQQVQSWPPAFTHHLKLCPALQVGQGSC